MERSDGGNRSGELPAHGTGTSGWATAAAAWQSLRIGVRTLSKRPGFACLAILVIAIGVGANVALFTVVRSVLLKPLPFSEPDRLLRIFEFSNDGKFPYNVTAPGVFAEWQAQSRSFSALAILRTGGTEYNLANRGGQLPERIQAAPCSWNLFPTLGVAPALGRGFAAADDSPAAAGTVILSWQLWQRRFGADPAALQQVIQLDSKPYTVIGVMPAWFAYPDRATQVWTPIRHEIPAEQMRALDNHFLVPIGRLAPGVTPSQALTELSGIVGNLKRAHPELAFLSRKANIRPMIDDVVGDLRGPLYLLLAATGCLLLIACLNVANLLMARAATRQRELAIRTALGSSKLRLLGQQVAESLLLSIAGGAGGLLLASTVVRWLVLARQDMSRSEGIHIDTAVVLFTVLLMFFCAAFAGILSAATGDGDSILATLQESSRSHGGSHGRARRRQVLVALEVGLTVVLLVTAGLLVKSFQRLRNVDLGCLRSNVLTMQFSLPDARYTQPAQRVAFFDSLLTRLRSLPGVQAAGLVSAVPGQGYMGDNGFTIAEHPPLPPGQGQYAISRRADPGYFAALGIPFLRGATFAAADRLERSDKIIISSAFARQFFAGEDPVGKHLVDSKRVYEIIGVVGDTRYEAAEAVKPMMYIPLLAGRSTDATIVVRAAAHVKTLALPVQRAVGELDRDLPVSDVLTMDELVDRSAVDASFEATLLMAFAVLSLILAAVGLFGVLSYIVAQRTSEFGVRMALGAQRGALLRLVLREGMQPAVAGIGLGIVLSFATVQFLRSLLFGVSPLDPAVFVTVTVALLLVGTIACLLPARRAARLDPLTALRRE